MTTDVDIEIIKTCLLTFAVIGVFGNANIICATWQNKILQHKCGIMLAILACCDTLCLLNEFQSFLRMTLKLGGTTLKRCFSANASYVFIEPFEVYMILVLALDRLFALNFVVLYRTVSRKKYILILVTPGVVIGFLFLIFTISNLDESEVEPCILPNAMPIHVSAIWNKYNLCGAVATLLVYFYTYIVVYCCTFKKTERNIVIQKSILNTVVVGAALFSISSVLSSALIAITSNMENPPLDPDTVSTYAVIPGLISYSCNFYVYFWRSTDYRNVFIKQLFCGKLVTSREKMATVVSGSNPPALKRTTNLCIS